ncbi:MAG: choice-of-anchor U domain-containing protein [Patescibacteria group bacterium]
MREFARFLGEALSLLAVVVVISIPLSQFTHAAGGEIFYEPPGYDLVNGALAQEQGLVSALENNPTGMTFSSDGTKMYTIGSSSDRVFEYGLATAYDLSTAYFIQNLYIFPQEQTPQDIEFSNDGTKMFIVGATSDSAQEYDLSVAYEISTASYVDGFSVNSKEATPTGLTFSADGLNMYIVGSTSDGVHQYSLSSAFDVSTASFVRTKSILAQDTSSTDVLFNGDGSKMYVTGTYNDRVYQYNLSTAYNISTATYSTYKSVNTQDSTPNGAVFNGDGSKMYMVGQGSDKVYQYTLGTNFDVSSASYDNVSLSLYQQLTNTMGMTYNEDGTEIYVVGAVRDMVDKYTLSTAYDISTASLAQSEYIGDQETSSTAISFNQDGTKMFITGSSSASVHEYSLSSAYDLSTISLINSLDVSAHETTPTGITLNEDGSKLYIVGQSSDSVHEFILSTPYDTSTASHNASFSIATEETNSTGLTFSANGSLLFVIGTTTDKVHQYQLSNNFDISTASYSAIELWVFPDDGTAQDLAFSSDGKKLYTVGSTNDKLFEYDTFSTIENGFTEFEVNSGSVDGQMVLYIEGETFQDTDADDILDVGSEIVFANLPSGLNPTIYLSQGDTVATVLMEGQATSNEEEEDGISDLKLTFTDSAFTGGNASSITNATGPASTGVPIDFIDGLYIKTSRHSIATDGSEGNDTSTAASVSDDGRYVAFFGGAALDPNDTNGTYDVYLRDTVTEETKILSADSLGNPGDDWSYDCMVSGNGEYVVFSSYSTNLVAGDTNGASDIFLYNIANETLTRVSKNSVGGQTTGSSYDTSISDDGRYIGFSSDSDDLVAGDTNFQNDIFIYDTLLDTNTIASVDSLGNQSDNYSFDPMISGNGEYIVYNSDATNLVAGDTYGATDVFLYDIQNQTTERISLSSTGTQLTDSSSYPSISFDGRYITFTNAGSDVVAGDTNSTYDIFLRDRQSSTTNRVSVSSSESESSGMSFGNSSISDDGRYIVFPSNAPDIVSGYGTGTFGLIMRDTVAGKTYLLSMSTGNVDIGNDDIESPMITGDGKYITYASRSVNLVNDDTNGQIDIFLTSFTTRNRLSYTAGTGGSIVGDNSQDIEYGEDGSAVSAVANSGYSFVDWSDGSTENPRTDTNVVANITVTANFDKDPATASGNEVSDDPSSTTPGSSGEYTGYTPDTDPIPNDIEDAGPNGGDANDDGTKDSQQDNVASFVNKVSDNRTVLEVSDSCTIQSVFMNAESDNDSLDESATYPLGLINFIIKCAKPGQTAEIKQYYYTESVEAAGLVMRKYSQQNNDYTNLADATIDALTIDKQAVIKASYNITDDGDLDEDGLENGVIVDPAGLARKKGHEDVKTEKEKEMSSSSVNYLPYILSAVGIALFIYLYRRWRENKEQS